MNIRKLDVCPYEEWIMVEVDGIEKTFELMNTNNSHIKVFYLDRDYKHQIIFNLKTRQLEETL